MARDYAQATAVCLYDENSASADNKYEIPRVSLCHCLQRDNNRFVTRGIRTVMVNRSAQVQTPAGLTDTESECRYQMSDQLTLKGWF